MIKIFNNLNSFFSIVCESLFKRLAYKRYNTQVITIKRYNDRWYVEPDKWPDNDIIKQYYLELINDTQRICDRFSKGEDTFNVLVEYSNTNKSLFYDELEPSYDMCVMMRKYKSFSLGALYDVIDSTNTDSTLLESYFTPCAMYMFGKYPKYIRITRL